MDFTRASGAIVIRAILGSNQQVTLLGGCNAGATSPFSELLLGMLLQKVLVTFKCMGKAEEKLVLPSQLVGSA